MKRKDNQRSGSESLSFRLSKQLKMISLATLIRVGFDWKSFDLNSSRRNLPNLGKQSSISKTKFEMKN